MAFNFKKFSSEAGTLFSRAKQFTEEKLGQAEKTELDAHFENLLQRADKTRDWTDKMLKQTEAVLQPNPSARVEELLYNKLDKRLRERTTNTELLGQHMIDAGNDFGPGTSYGSALVKVGQTEQKLGQAERDFIQSSANNYLQPLKAFLEGDMKTVAKERKILETKRLDLDACKNRLRRAKSQSNKEQINLDYVQQTALVANFGPGQAPALVIEGAAPNPQEDEALAKAEGDLRVAQSEFDRQAEITKLLLEGISSTHAHHLRCLHDMVEAQMTYYSQCQQYMSDLQRQLGNFGGVKAGGGSTSPNIHAPSYGGPATSASPAGQLNNHSNEGGRNAKVLYDYDAADMSELSLVADEMITVYRIPGMDDWVMGQRGVQRGKVPTTYLEIID